MESVEIIWLIQSVKRVPKLNLVIKDTIAVCTNKEAAERHISEMAVANKVKIPEHAMGFDLSEEEGIYSVTLPCYDN